MLDDTPGRARLSRLLHAYNEHPDQREQIVAEIEEYHQRHLAILVLDSSSFSRTVQSTGIVPFLARMERVERLTLPLIERTGGRLLRRQDDHIYAVFPDVTAAVTCAEAISRDVNVCNGPLAAADEIYVAIGVGWGEVPVVDDDDIFGGEMNLACKLGEDLAQHNEVLLTAKAYEELEDSAWQFEEMCFGISGIELNAYRLKREASPIVPPLASPREEAPMAE